MASIQPRKTKSGIYYYLAEKINGKCYRCDEPETSDEIVEANKRGNLLTGYIQTVNKNQ